MSFQPCLRGKALVNSYGGVGLEKAFVYLPVKPLFDIVNGPAMGFQP
jgi:hypothetical protein